VPHVKKEIILCLYMQQLDFGFHFMSNCFADFANFMTGNYDSSLESSEHLTAKEEDGAARLDATNAHPNFLTW